MDDIDREIEGVTGMDEDKTGSSQELIHPNEVMKALRAFVEDNKQPPK